MKSLIAVCVIVMTLGVQQAYAMTQFYFWLPGDFLRDTPVGAILSAEVDPDHEYSWKYNGTWFYPLHYEPEPVDADDGAAHLDCCGGPGLNDWLFAVADNNTIGERVIMCVEGPTQLQSICTFGVVDNHDTVMGMFENNKLVIDAFNITNTPYS